MPLSETSASAYAFHSVLSLDRTKRFGLDFLFTYLLHPGTAVYVGYTDIYKNMHLDPYVPPNLQWTGMPDTSVGRQFFMKLQLTC